MGAAADAALRAVDVLPLQEMGAVVIVDPARRGSQRGNRILLRRDARLELLDRGGGKALALLDGAAGKKADSLMNPRITV